MKPNHAVQEPPEKPLPTRTAKNGAAPKPEPEGAAWQFKALVAVIALSVLTMVLKSFGVF